LEGDLDEAPAEDQTYFINANRASNMLAKEQEADVDNGDHTKVLMKIDRKVLFQDVSDADGSDMSPRKAAGREHKITPTPKRVNLGASVEDDEGVSENVVSSYKDKVLKLFSKRKKSDATDIKTQQISSDDKEYKSKRNSKLIQVFIALSMIYFAVDYFLTEGGDNSGDSSATQQESRKKLNESGKSQPDSAFVKETVEEKIAQEPAQQESNTAQVATPEPENNQNVDLGQRPSETAEPIPQESTVEDAQNDEKGEFVETPSGRTDGEAVADHGQNQENSQPPAEVPSKEERHDVSAEPVTADSSGTASAVTTPSEPIPDAQPVSQQDSDESGEVSPTPATKDAATKMPTAETSPESSDHTLDVKKEFEKQSERPVGPDYRAVGRGLVYNCKVGYWACVDKKPYFDCEADMNWAIRYGKVKYCATVNIYATDRDCEIVQKYNVNMNIKSPPCSD